MDLVPVLYAGLPDWRGDLISQDGGSFLETSIPPHLEFAKKKQAQPNHFAQVVRLVKFWARRMKQERDGFRFKSFMVEMILAKLCDDGVDLSDYPRRCSRSLPTLRSPTCVNASSLRITTKPPAWASSTTSYRSLIRSTPATTWRSSTRPRTLLPSSARFIRWIKPPTPMVRAEPDASTGPQPLAGLRHGPADAPTTRRICRHRRSRPLSAQGVNHESTLAGPLRAQVESLLCRSAHCCGQRPAQSRGLLLADRTCSGPGGGLRPDPGRSRHRQERDFCACWRSACPGCRI